MLPLAEVNENGVRLCSTSQPLTNLLSIATVIPFHESPPSVYGLESSEVSKVGIRFTFN